MRYLQVRQGDSLLQVRLSFFGGVGKGEVCGPRDTDGRDKRLFKMGSAVCSMIFIVTGLGNLVTLPGVL